MKTLENRCRIAVVQAAPVFFDKDACVEKAVRLIEKPMMRHYDNLPRDNRL